MVEDVLKVATREERDAMRKLYYGEGAQSLVMTERSFNEHTMTTMWRDETKACYQHRKEFQQCEAQVGRRSTSNPEHYLKR